MIIDKNRVPSAESGNNSTVNVIIQWNWISPKKYSDNLSDANRETGNNIKNIATTQINDARHQGEHSL